MLGRASAYCILSIIRAFRLFAQRSVGDRSLRSAVARPFDSTWLRCAVLCGLQSVPWADPPFSALLKQILNSATRYVIFVNFVPDFTKWDAEQMWLYTLSMMLIVLLAWLLLTCPVSARL